MPMTALILILATSWAFPLHVHNVIGEHMCTVNDNLETDVVSDVKEKIRRRTKIRDFELVWDLAMLNNETATLGNYGITAEAVLNLVKSSEAIYSYGPGISNQESSVALREEKTTHVQINEALINDIANRIGIIFALIGMFVVPIKFVALVPPIFWLFGPFVMLVGFWAGAIPGSVLGGIIGGVLETPSAIRSIWKRKISVMSFEAGSENWIIKVPRNQRRFNRCLKRSDLEQRMRIWKHLEEHSTGNWFYELEDLTMEEILNLIFPISEGYEHIKNPRKNYLRSYQHWEKRKIITYLQEVWKEAPVYGPENITWRQTLLRSRML